VCVHIAKCTGNVPKGGTVHGHGYSNSTVGAVADALEAGCDVEYDNAYAKDAQAAVDQGLVSEATLRAAVRRCCVCCT
jgi:beta-glucosidase-like glycosyl hydrolase